MPEIGETLREARMRRRIDMTEVETATKIRGKYLRALENEEWELLPGPTFVKSFLRTYAEYLDLDARLLVEEYRQRYERPTQQDLTPLGAARRGGPVRRRRQRLAAMGPVLVMGVGAVVLLAFLYVLGVWGDDNGGSDMPAGANRPRATATPTATPDSTKRTPARPQRVRLRLVATGPVYVCVVNSAGDQVIDEQTLQTGTRTPSYKSRWFRTNFGNSNVEMMVNGRKYRVEPSPDPIGYELRPGRRPRRLSDAARPDCSS
jgi:transcriptional regulator with XRE-family HTH domain